MIWLMMGLLSIATGVGLWLMPWMAFGALPWSANPFDGVSEVGLLPILFLIVLFYGPFVFGAYCLWKAVQERLDTSGVDDAQD